MCVCPHVITPFPINGFPWSSIMNIFRKYVEKIQVSLKSDINKWYFIWRRLYIYLNISLNEKHFIKKKVVEKIKTQILSAISVFRKSCGLWDKMEKQGTARHATDSNIIHHMRFACPTNKATDTQKTHTLRTSIHIAFPLHQWFHECSSLLRSYANFLSCWNLLFHKTYIPLTLGARSRCSTHSQINVIYKTNVTHFLNNHFHFTNHPPHRSAKCFSVHV